MWDELLEALRGTGIPFAEQEWRNVGSLKSDYGILRLRGAGDSSWADGHQQAEAMVAAVHLFTRSAGLSQAEQIKAVLNSIEGLSFRMTDNIYENDTKLTHWVWTVEWGE